MKRSFKNLFMVIMILVSLVGSSIQVAPVDALGTFMKESIGSLPGSLQLGALRSVWSIDADNVFAVGYGKVASQASYPKSPVVYRKSGTWSSSSPALPDAAWGNGQFNAVWGATAGSRVFAVGAGGAGVSPNLPMAGIWEDDGGEGSWTMYSLPLPTTPSSPVALTTGYLYAAWGSSADDVYAVGNGTDEMGGIYPMVSHWDGNNWTSKSLNRPSSAWVHGYLYGIWGSGPSDIYAVGNGGYKTTVNGQLVTKTVPLLYHYDGSTWTSQSSSLVLPAGWNSGYLEGIWGYKNGLTTYIYAVGSGSKVGTTSPLLFYYNGSAWSLVDLPLPSASWNRGELKGVWGTGDNVYLTGFGFNGSVNASFLYRKTSRGWVVSSYLPGEDLNAIYQGISGSSPTDIYTVGASTVIESQSPSVYHAGPDGIDPGAVNLTATSGPTKGKITLRWTAPPDDSGNSNSGPVTSYLVRYSDQDNLASCNDGSEPIDEPPVPLTPGSNQTMVVSGLTPETTYYFSVCALDEDGRMGAFVTPSASAVASNSDVGIYDDRDTARWSYSGTWNESINVTGPYDKTIHYTRQKYATASFTFQAPAYFSFYYAKATNRGKFQIYVDDVLVATINAYATKKSWQNKYVGPVFTDKLTHTVTIKNITTKEADVDAIEIHDLPTPVGPGIYDSTDLSRWVYSGVWKKSVVTGPYNNTIHFTRLNQDSASFVFQAPAAFVFYYAKYTNRGKFQIYVDGEYLTEINAYATTKSWQNAYVSPAYTDDKSHVITIKNISAKEMDVDVIKIYDPTPVGPDAYDDTELSWIYSGVWKVSTGINGPTNGTVHYTTQKNATASITFQGPATFAFYYAKASNRGKFQILVDDVPIATINAYAGKQSWNNVYVSVPYDGVHKITIKNITGGKRCDVDVIVIE